MTLIQRLTRASSSCDVLTAYDVLSVTVSELGQQRDHKTLIAAST